MSELGAEFLRQVSKVIEMVGGQKCHQALVVDGNDKDKAGKVQVFVYGVHPSELENRTDILPWATPMQSSDFKGGFVLPQKGQIVNVEFENDNINYPRWTTQAYSKSRLPSHLSDGVYGDTIVLFELTDSIWGTMSRSTGEFKFQFGDVQFTSDKAGNILIDNHLAVTGSQLLDIMPSKDASELSKEALAELVSKTGTMGAGIRIKSSGEVTIEAPKVTHGGKPSIMGLVEPGINPLGSGGYNCLPVCPFVGLVHQGNSVQMVYSQSLETVKQLAGTDSDS